VRLNSLHLTNFRQHADTRIEFDLGLTGVIGPNGAGKTTILEAIAWALYGQPAARGTRDSIRFLRAGPRAPVRVDLDFELGGHRYRVLRGLSTAELYLDSGAEPIASTITGVTELLQRRLGMTRAEFFHTYFTGQKELNVMAAMAPAERAQFLSRVLGYDKLRTAQALVRKRRSEISSELAGVRSMMPNATVVERQLEETRERLADAERRRAQAEQRTREAEAAFALLSPHWASAQEARDRQQQLLADLRVAESDQAARERDFDRVARDLAEVTTARADLDRVAAELAPLTEVQDEFRRLEELAREEGRRQTLVETERLLAEELARLRDRRVSIVRAPRLEEEITATLTRKRSELEEALGRLELRRTDWVRDRQEAETRRDALRRQYQEVKAQRDRILDLGEEGVCPTCTRVLGANFRTVLDQLEEQMETVAVDGRYFGTRLEQLQETPEDIRELDARRRALAQELATLERQLAQAQAAVEELAHTAREMALKEQRQEALQRELRALPTGYDAARHAVLREQVARLAPLNERATRLSAQIDREPALRAEHERLAEERRGAADRVAGLRARIEETRFSEEDFARVRVEFEEAQAAARAAEVALTSARADEAGARAAREAAEREHVDMQRKRERLQALEADKRLHDELDRAYSDLRTDLNFQLRPELAELASAFLSDLTDARYSEIELDDQYNVVVLEDGMAKPVISGGEEDLSNLVLRLAISQMIAERAGQTFSLLVLDEVFGSLDEVKRHNVVELLRGLQDRFEQVILITHIESVRDELDRVILVDYDEQTGASRARQVEPAAAPLDELLQEASPGTTAGAADR
jgi:exonuclease SbcC